MPEDFEYKQSLGKVAPAQRKRLFLRSNAQGLKRVLSHGGLLCCGGLWISLQWPFWWLVLLPYGITLAFVFCALHELVHRTPFATRHWNDWLAALSGFVVFVPAMWFRYFHFDHHRYTQIPGRDPELASPKPETMWQYARHVSGLPEWFARFRLMAVNAVGRNRDPWIPDNARRRIQTESFTHLLLYVVLAVLSIGFNNDVLLWVWIIPSLIGNPFLRLYLLAEHGGCDEGPDMLRNSRTTSTNAIVRLIAWNMPYHVEHHCFPAVPFYRLPELHQVLKSRIAYTSPGYIAFNRQFVKGLTGS